MKAADVEAQIEKLEGLVADADKGFDYHFKAIRQLTQEMKDAQEEIRCLQGVLEAAGE